MSVIRLYALTFKMGLWGTLGTLWLASPAFAQDVRVLNTQTTELQADGLESHVVARGLGEISDMALAEDGTVFTTDQRSGRIWTIRDRGLDGNADIVQALPHRFDRPSGIAISKGQIFVTDRGGLWRIEAAGTPVLIAPFAKANAAAGPHPLAIDETGILSLGLTRSDGTAQLLSVDPMTGTARNVASVPGIFVAFSKGPASTPQFKVIQNQETTFIGPTLETLQPLASGAQSVWIDADLGRLVIGTENGLFAQAATILGIEDERDAILTGVSVGSILIDERGILFAAKADGSLRLIRPRRARRSAKPTPPIVPELSLDPEPLILRGSGIGEASQIEQFKDEPNQKDEIVE